MTARNAAAQNEDVNVRGGCEIIEVRSGPGQVDYSFCDKLAKIDYKTYRWLVPVLRLAFDAAERGTCGSLRCSTGARKVDVVVTGNAFATAGVSFSKAQLGASDQMVFFLTTGLADMIQASTTSYEY